jgi:hypothetical protein
LRANDRERYKQSPYDYREGKDDCILKIVHDFSNLEDFLWHPTALGVKRSCEVKLVLPRRFRFNSWLGGAQAAPYQE